MSQRQRALASFSISLAQSISKGDAVRSAEGKYEITIYTSCWNAQKGIYYYTTYTGHQITAVDMHREDLDGAKVVSYPMLQEERIYWQQEIRG